MKLSILAITLAAIAQMGNEVSAEPLNTAKHGTYMAELMGEVRRLEDACDASISYSGIVGSDPVESEISCDAIFDAPSTWDFYKLWLDAGTHTIDVDRVDCEMDPASALFAGIAPGAELTCGFVDDEEDVGGLVFVQEADDNNGLPAGCEGGPFFDPSITVDVETGGWYTLAVKNFFSGDCPADGNFDYLITAPTARDGGIYDDPHIKTWNGTWYDFHGECDMVFLDAPTFEEDKALSIQVRTTIRYFYSYIETAVLQIGEDKLEVTSFGGYAWNEIDGANLAGADLAGYPIYHYTPSPKRHVFDVVLGPSENITLSTFKDLVSVSVKGATEKHFGDSTGLMGNFRNGELARRDGMTVVSSEQQELNAFGQEWQVGQDEPMLFRSARHPQNPEKCKMPKMDANGNVVVQRRLGQTAISRPVAEAACAHAPADRKEACVFDVMAIGDIDIASGGAY